MTLLDAPAYDQTHTNHYRSVSAVVLVVIAGLMFLFFRNLPAEHRVNQFFSAVEAQDFTQAYGIWNNDPNWQQHVRRYDGYSYGRFLVDWGESGDYGRISSHRILHSTSLGNTNLLAVEVNGHKTPLILAVTKNTHTMSYPPFALTPVKDDFGWTDWQVSYR
jgi:hypothetical protein